MDEKRQITVVVGLIKNEKGKILLQKRVDPLIPDAHEKWEFPGGRIDFGESPVQALERECKEEIGCEITVLRLLPTVQSPIWTRTDNKSQQVFVLCYEAHIVNGTPHPLDKKVSEVGWFSKEEIQNMDTLLGIKDFISMSL
ncbi:MAG: hypothetical protein A3C11_00645 [Candidatus Sungbacteria bacterium RIFCSPHIGHO2_02_FULL_49_12]|uniref:Nudix hydrolase domain-containing protein n=1 Tax=Candidatus Sungbacteria bacterium RIFCSPHIGHO2_02_FULL_49_12 TaxID=1802271 RepID=A0A1G2KLN4_9BACT|nr:MAG: hypothetical protein A3C11_00645 [Candidatus Sungbacteria bacterium RIFCSPHIGHO2_02_FULL_49_12]